MLANTKRTLVVKGKKRTEKKNVLPKFNAQLGLGLPKKMTITHRFAESQQVACGTGAIGSYLWSTNGLYDPNFTGSGHQPMDFDNLTAIYDHYCVIGSYATIKVIPSTSSTAPTNVAFYIGDNSSVPASVTPALAWEQNDAPASRSKAYQLIPQDDSAPRTMSCKWSARKRFGKGVLANNNLSGTSSSNPTEQSYFTFLAQSFDQTASVTMYIEIQITYITVWYELQDVAPN